MEALHATIMEKSKAEKGPWLKKRKKNRSKKERNSSILPKKEKGALPKATRALGLAKYLPQSQHLLKIRTRGPVSQKSKLTLTLTLTEVLISDKSEKPASSNTYGK